jgi:hypothetical protein
MIHPTKTRRHFKIYMSCDLLELFLPFCERHMVQWKIPLPAMDQEWFSLRQLKYCVLGHLFFSFSCDNFLSYDSRLFHVGWRLIKLAVAILDLSDICLRKVMTTLFKKNVVSWYVCICKKLNFKEASRKLFSLFWADRMFHYDRVNIGPNNLKLTL